MQAYLQIKGIDGDVTEKDHVKWINVTGFNWGLSQRLFGNAQGREQHGTGQADVREFVITKELDSSSPNLALYCAQNKAVSDVTLHVITKQNEKNHKTMEIKLKDCIISSVQLSGMANGSTALPEETVAIRFAEISQEYVPLKKDGSAGGSIKMTFNVKANA